MQVYAVDLNPLALSYAAFNAERMGVAQRVQPLEGSWFEPLHQAGVGMLAGVVSNPPYITSQQMPSLQAEVGRCGGRMLNDLQNCMAGHCSAWQAIQQINRLRAALLHSSLVESCQLQRFLAATW